MTLFTILPTPASKQAARNWKVEGEVDVDVERFSRTISTSPSLLRGNNGWAWLNKKQGFTQRLISWKNVQRSFVYVHTSSWFLLGSRKMFLLWDEKRVARATLSNSWKRMVPFRIDRDGMAWLNKKLISFSKSLVLFFLFFISTSLSFFFFSFFFSFFLVCACLWRSRIDRACLRLLAAINMEMDDSRKCD